jgi:hypothetical protein
MHNGAVCFVSLAISSDFLSIHALLSNISLKSCPRRQGENKSALCLACLPHPSRLDLPKSALPHSCTVHLTKAATHRSCTVKAGKDRAFYQKRAGQSPFHIFHRQSLIEYSTTSYLYIPLLLHQGSIQATSPRILLGTPKPLAKHSPPLPRASSIRKQPHRRRQPQVRTHRSSSKTTNTRGSFPAFPHPQLNPSSNQAP